MKVSAKNIPKKKTEVKQVTQTRNLPIYGPTPGALQNSPEMMAKLDEISKTLAAQKPIIPESNKAEIKTNHEDLVRIITENMNAVMAKLKEDRVIQVDVKRNRSGLIESLTFKSIENAT